LASPPIEKKRNPGITALCSWNGCDLWDFFFKWRNFTKIFTNKILKNDFGAFRWLKVREKQKTNGKVFIFGFQCIAKIIEV